MVLKSEAKVGQEKRTYRVESWTAERGLKERVRSEEEEERRNPREGLEGRGG